jgi:heptaprenylglyceryl phosphate synthase
LKAAFIFLAPNAQPELHQAVVETEAVHLITVGVDSYRSAAEQAKKLVEGGVTAIELCGGFGHKGVAKVCEAVEGKAKVGVVRFDSHPGLDHKSGDDLF